MVFFIAFNGNSQNIITVGEIFDFNVNDEFQSFNDIPQSGPPNAIRMKIVEKHFSLWNDTVFYTRSFDNYFTEFNTYPSPHLDYFFSSYTDSIFYTNLNSNVFCPDTSCDSIISTTICSVISNGWEIAAWDVYDSKVFGKGLGVIRDVHWVNQTSGNYDYKLFYFKKDTLLCGTPDITTSINTNELSDLVEIFPNPFISQATFRFGKTPKNASLMFYDVHGQLVKQIINISSKSVTLNRDNLPAGLYLLRIEQDDKILGAEKVFITN